MAAVVAATEKQPAETAAETNRLVLWATVLLVKKDSMNGNRKNMKKIIMFLNINT